MVRDRAEAAIGRISRHGEQASKEDFDSFFEATGRAQAQPTAESVAWLASLDGWPGLRAAIESVRSDTLRANLMRPLEEGQRLAALPYWQKRLRTKNLEDLLR
jgi:hypothetical protein